MAALFIAVFRICGAALCYRIWRCSAHFDLNAQEGKSFMVALSFWEDGALSGGWLFIAAIFISEVT
jgi:hypothetical protein